MSEAHEPEPEIAEPGEEHGGGGGGALYFDRLERPFQFSMYPHLYPSQLLDPLKLEMWEYSFMTKIAAMDQILPLLL